MNTKEYFNAKQRLQAYLTEHPELMPMQKKIEQRLSGAGSTHNRMLFLKVMMEEKLIELRNALKGLVDVSPK